MTSNLDHTSVEVEGRRHQFRVEALRNCWDEHICRLLGDKRISSRAKKEQFNFVGVDSNQE